MWGEEGRGASGSEGGGGGRRGGGLCGSGGHRAPLGEREAPVAADPPGTPGCPSLVALQPAPYLALVADAQWVVPNSDANKRLYGKRRRNDDNGNDRNCKRSAVMRVCTTGEGNGSDLGAGGSGNEAGGGEMEYHPHRAEPPASSGWVLLVVADCDRQKAVAA